MAKTQEKEFKCFANLHMTPAEFGFWEVCRSVTHKWDYHLIFDGRDIAENFDGIGKDVAYRLTKKLCNKGWFVCTKKPKQGQGGKYCSAEYKVLSHEEWADKHGTRHCRKPRTSPVAEMRMALETAPENQSRKREPSSRENANHPVAETRHSTEDPPLLNTKPSEELRVLPKELRVLPKSTPSLDGKEGTQKTHGDSDKVWPVAETRTATESPVAQTRTMEEPFAGIPTSQLVTSMLPHKVAMQLFNKYNKGTEYNEHRAEIIAAVLEYQQKTQEVQQ